MAITIDLPPSMAQEAEGYATLEGTTIEQLFIESLAAELRRKREAKKLLLEFDAYVSNLPKLSGEPYRFCRKDAYEEELA